MRTQFPNISLKCNWNEWLEGLLTGEEDYVGPKEDRDEIHSNKEFAPFLNRKKTSSPPNIFEKRSSPPVDGPGPGTP